MSQTGAKKPRVGTGVGVDVSEFGAEPTALKPFSGAAPTQGAIGNVLGPVQSDIAAADAEAAAAAAGPIQMATRGVGGYFRAGRGEFEEERGVLSRATRKVGQARKRLLGD